MNKVNRREWLAGLAAAALVPGLGAGLAQQATKHPKESNPPKGSKLALEDYLPKSMLHVPETKVPRARFAVIDFHTHLSWSPREGTKPRYNTTPENALAVMDRRNVRTMVNLTGGYGPILDENIRYWQDSHPGRFVVFTEPMYNRITEAQ